MKKIAYLLPAICLALFSGSAKADTLKLVGAATGETGPYQLQFDGTTSVSLFCLDDKREVRIGESWQVNVVNGDTYLNSGKNSTGFEYEEEAYIHSMLGVSNGHGYTYSANDVQEALWYIFDHSEGTNSHAASLVSAASTFSYTSSFLGGYSFYIPTGNDIVDGNGLGLPQDMIGTAIKSVSPTPEPSSLLLLGSGLVGLAGAIRRKQTRA